MEQSFFQVPQVGTIPLIDSLKTVIIYYADSNKEKYKWRRKKQSR